MFLDEWSTEHAQSDKVKLLLQGCLMISAVKYEKASMFINSLTFYVTKNNVPNFGKDEDTNVKRRLKIFETKSMQKSQFQDRAMVSAEFYVRTALP